MQCGCSRQTSVDPGIGAPDAHGCSFPPSRRLCLAWPILGNKTKARFSFSKWAPGHAPLHVCLSDQQASSAFFLPSEFISAPVLPCVTFGLQERKRGGV